MWSCACLGLKNINHNFFLVGAGEADFKEFQVIQLKLLTLPQVFPAAGPIWEHCKEWCSRAAQPCSHAGASVVLDGATLLTERNNIGSGPLRSKSRRFICSTWTEGRE